MQTMQKFGNDDWDGFVNDFLGIGGDFRIQGLNYKTNNEQKTAFLKKKWLLVGSFFKKRPIDWPFFSTLSIFKKKKLLRFFFQ